MKAASTEAKHGFTEIFLFSEPEDGRPYRVLRDEWDHDFTVRTIEDWEYVE